MEILDVKKPSKEEQRTAMESYHSLVSTLRDLNSENAEIEIAETDEKIKIPVTALKILAEILKEISQGNPISIVPIATEMTTQAAAELLGCSRPHIVKLLETGQIKYTMVGKHRRIKYEDVVDYKKNLKAKQKSTISEIMQLDEELGLYDS